MKNTYSQILICTAVLLLTSCAGARQAKQLAAHQSLLQDYSMADLPTEEKIDAMATSLVKMMNETLDILNPKKGVAYLKKYEQQNGQAIDLILTEVSEWQDKMDTLEKIGFVTNMLSKPYTAELFELIPKIERKYRQVKFVMDLTSKVKNGLGGLAGKFLTN